MYFKMSALVGIVSAVAAHAGEPDACVIQQNQQQQQQQVTCEIQQPVQQEQQQQAQEQAQQAQDQAQQVIEQQPVAQQEPAQEPCPVQQAEQVPDVQQEPIQAPIQQQQQQQQQAQQQAVAQQGFAPFVAYSYVNRTGAREILNVRVVRHVDGANYGTLRVETFEGYIVNTNMPAKLILRHSLNSLGQVTRTTATLEINGNIVMNDTPVSSLVN